MKVNRVNTKQIDWTFGTAKKILGKYLNVQLDDNAFKQLINDCNYISKETKEDCLTQKIMIAISEYLEELEKSERDPYSPETLDEKVQPEVTGFNVTGFEVPKEVKKPEIKGFEV